MSKHPSVGLDPLTPPVVVGEQTGRDLNDPAQLGDAESDDSDAHRPGLPALTSDGRASR